MNTQLLNKSERLVEWQSIKKSLPQHGQPVAVKCECSDCGEQKAFYLTRFHILIPNICENHLRKEGPSRSIERLTTTITHWKPIIKKGEEDV